MLPHRRLVRTLVLLALVALAAHAMALLGVTPGSLPSTGDTLGAFVPWHEFARRNLQLSGVMPLWNPHVYCGMPFLGNGQSGLLYPPNYIHFLLPENLALWVFAFGHSWLLMAGTYFLGRNLGLKRRSSFFVAILFGLGNANAAHLFGGHLTFLPARAYWPWEAAFLLRILRRERQSNAVWLAVYVALGLAAGAPQIWLFGLLFCAGIFGVWLLSPERMHWREVVAPLLFAALLVLLFCAPTILPLRELRDWSSHGDKLTFAQVSQLGATSRSVFRLLINGFFGGNSFFMWSLQSNPGEDAASLGFAPFVLAFCAPLFVWKSKTARWLYGGCMLAVALALGARTPLYGFLFEHITLFQITRVPARWLELWAFGAALLCGFVFDAFLLRPSQAARLQKVWVAAAVGCAVLSLSCLRIKAPWQRGAAIVASSLQLPPRRLPEIAASLQSDALLSCLITAATLGLLAVVWRKGLRLNAVIGLVIGVLAADPLMQFWLSTRITPPETSLAVRVPSSITRRFTPGSRWIARAPFGQLNAPMMAGLETVNGYEPFGSAPFFEFANAAEPPSGFQADYQPHSPAPLWRVVGASHLLWKRKQNRDATNYFSGRSLVHSGEWNLNSMEDGLEPWPRAYLTRDLVRTSTRQRYAELKKIAAIPFSRRKAAVVEPDFPTLQPPVASGGTVNPGFQTPDVLNWQVIAPAQTAFIDQDALAPGWKAYVDNEAVPLHRANGFMRGLIVPSGSHRVTLVFNSETLRLGFFLALCGLSFAAAALNIGRRKRA